MQASISRYKDYAAKRHIVLSIYVVFSAWCID